MQSAHPRLKPFLSVNYAHAPRPILENNALRRKVNIKSWAS